MIRDGKTGQTIADFLAFEETFRGGVSVATADLNADGVADLIVTPDVGGGPVVVVYDGAKLARGLSHMEAQINRFYGILDPQFRGGARAAIGDLNRDGSPDLVVTAGALGGPRVSILSGQDVLAGSPNPAHLTNDFFAFEGSFRNGTSVSIGDFDGDGFLDLAFGAEAGGGPRVRVINGLQLLTMPNLLDLDSAVLQNNLLQLSDFFSSSPELRGGVRVALRDQLGTGQTALVIGSGVNEPARVRIYRSNRTLVPDLTQELEVFNGLPVPNGVFVG
jgi:hypothetical protein